MQKWFGKLDLFGRGKVEQLRRQIDCQGEQIRILTNQLDSERKRPVQFALLGEIDQPLKAVLDQQVAAQLVADAIQNIYHCETVTILAHNTEHDEFHLLATAGRGKYYVPPSYTNRTDRKLIERALRQQTVLITNDTNLEPGSGRDSRQDYLSEMIVPLTMNGAVKGVLTMEYSETKALQAAEVAVIEMAAKKLADAWERSNYHQRLTDLVQGSIVLSSSPDTQAVIEKSAVIARKVTRARFALVMLLGREEHPPSLGHAGEAPKLLRDLKKNPKENPLIRAVLNSTGILRISDIRKFAPAAHLAERADFNCLLAFPIRLRQRTIGAILLFGKEGQAFFTENDESLAVLLEAQAAAAIESSWLYQELRSSLQIATLQYQLSARVMQSDSLQDAAEIIAESAFKLGRASLTGIILFTADRQVQAQVEVDANGIQPGSTIPQTIVEQALQTRQTIILSDDRFASKICIPLQTPRHVYGALWLDIPEGRWSDSRFAADLQTLTNQASVALERSLLLIQTSNQTRLLEAAYHELETTYDQTLSALTSALDARDRDTEGHSARVARIASSLGRELGLSERQVKALERGALLHDIGKIGVSDTILLKPGPLTEAEWQSMRLHPVIGARIVEGIPFLLETMPILRHHHEHWDGSGYPSGLAGEDIPLLARIFSVVDGFDAMLSDRPYRKRTAKKEVYVHLLAGSGSLYDPEVVGTFLRMLEEKRFNSLF